jgi:CubicO group peptidase (beta-lactamase class C family)
MKRALLCYLGLVLTTACSDSSSAPDPDPPSSVQTGVERRIDEAVAAGFSGAILVSLDGERLVASGHGLADREHETPNRAETAFDAGSIMKTVTTLALFTLAEDGRLALSDSLAELLPDVPADKAMITVRQIVQHQAGFDEYHDTMGDFEPMTRLEARARIFEQELLFEPGSDEAYSNSGYTLLADIVETVSDSAFTDYVRQNVFTPAGMEHSGFYPDELWKDVDTAIGYDASTFGVNDPATWPYTWALVGNGGLVTTVIDLERFGMAVWSGTLLGPETQGAFEDDYLSLGAAELAGEAVYGAAGAGDYGLGAAVIEVPARSARIAIATNTYEAFDIETFAVELTTFLLQGE